METKYRIKSGNCYLQSIEHVNGMESRSWGNNGTVFDADEARNMVKTLTRQNIDVELERVDKMDYEKMWNDFRETYVNYHLVKGTEKNLSLTFGCTTLWEAMREKESEYNQYITQEEKEFLDVLHGRFPVGTCIFTRAGNKVFYGMEVFPVLSPYTFDGVDFETIHLEDLIMYEVR